MKKPLHAAPAGSAAKPSAPTTAVGPEILLLDTATQEDLNLFAADALEPLDDDAAETVSLFGFCNKTRSEGGERVLRRRMLAPWAEAQRIRATQ